MGNGELFVDADDSKCSVYFTHSIAWHYVNIENEGSVVGFMDEEPYRGRLLVDTAHLLRPRFGLDRDITLSIKNDCAHFVVNLVDGEDSVDDSISTIREVYDAIRKDHDAHEMFDICIDVVPRQIE